MKQIDYPALVQQVGTPFYVFDASELHRRIAQLQQAFGENIHLCYAIKANAFLLPHLGGQVPRLEICSPGELEICRKLGLPPESYVVSGVYKEPQLMRSLIQKPLPVAAYTVESTRQFTLLRQAAAEAGVQIPVLLRLTSGNQFGLDASDLETLIAEHHDDPYLDLRGIQFFSGTQKTSLKKIRRELDMLDTFLETLAQRYDYQAQELEYGPGLPVSYFPAEAFDEPPFLQTFAELLQQMRFSGQITLELGRSIAASCGHYLTSIVDAKCNRGERYAIVDGGMHQLTYFGQFMAMKHPEVRLLQPRPGAEEELWNICGALCTANDLLVKQLPLAAPAVGDVLVFSNTGAYCVTEGISLFLSRDLPAVVLLDAQGEPQIVRGHLQTAALNTPQI